MRRFQVPILLSLASCAAGASNPQRQLQPEQCATRLAPRPGPPTRQSNSAESRPARQSQVVVHAEMPLAALGRTLEARISPQLGAGQVRIGPGGTVSYTAERGALSLSVSRTALLVETPVRARAEACRGDDCYASCAPEALVRAEVPLLLRPDYRFEKTTVSLRFTRGCKVRALGGLLTVDVTPTLEAALMPELGRVAQRIDEQLPDLRGELEHAWRELGAARELPLGGCFLLQPRGVVQGPMSPSAQVLSARFALLATPELRSVCGQPTTIDALPELQRDLTLPDDGLLQLAMVTPLSKLARSIESSGQLPSSRGPLHVAQADVAAQGSDVDLQLVLTGDVCGNVALGASPEFSGDGQFVGLARPRASDTERMRLNDARVDADALLRELAAAVHLAPLLSVRGFRDAAPMLAAGLSQPGVDVSASLASARAAGAVARGDDLVAWLEARGAIWLRQKTPQR